MHDTAYQLIVQYGAPGLFVLLMFGIIGVPVPDETLLTGAGILIRQGELNPAETWCAALGGSLCGITVSFLIGRVAGVRVLRRWGRWLHLTEGRVERFDRWFARAGRWTLLFGYFVPGFRHVAAMAAGTSQLPWPSFAGFAYTGAVLWVSIFLASGYFLAEGWSQTSVTVHRWMLIAGGAALVVGAFYGLIRWLRPPGKPGPGAP